MSFPRISKTIDNTQIKIQEKYLVKKYELVLDRLKCVGCGQCSIVCPKEAILFGPASAVYENKPKDLNASVVDTIDPEKCVYCGTCVAFCPFDAIHLHEDGEPVKVDDMRIVQFHSIPKLESKTVFCDQIKRDAQVYWDGTMEVTYEVPQEEIEFKKYYTNKCPGDCRKCETICPTGAISFATAEEGFKEKIHIIVDDEKCIKCSACALVCPQDNFIVKWTSVHTSGPFNDIFWSPIKERLLDQKVKFTEE